MNRIARIIVSGTVVITAAGCSDFLTGGELSTDPNRASAATNTQLFVGIQSNIMALLGSDIARSTGIFSQQFSGGLQQYLSLEQTYEVNEQTTNGFHKGLYSGGGLIDVRGLQKGALAANDSLMLGISKVQEALLMGTGADLFGDLVYSNAFTGPNPTLDKQLDIYDALQVVLDDGIKCLGAVGPLNIGPGGADLAYGGNKAAWIRLAHTLKARYLMHTAEVRNVAATYTAAATQASQGILTTSQDFIAVFSGKAGEQNFYYNFDQGTAGRFGYLIPNAGFVTLLQSRADPRLPDYFNPGFDDLSDARLAPDYTQHLITAQENTLLWAEAAFRAGDPVTAQTQSNNGRALSGLGPQVLVGTALLTNILTEKYIAEFQSIESWMDYKRNCWPNLNPTAASKKIPARLPYDADERQTDTNIPALIDQPSRNQNDPVNATDPTGAVCKGQ